MKSGRIVYKKVADLNLVYITGSRPEFKGAEKKVDDLMGYIKPVLYWADLTLEENNGHKMVFEKGALTVESRYMAEGLKGCGSATLTAATIGRALPGHSEACMKKGRLWEGTIADMLGSLAVEAVIDRFYVSVSEAKRDKGLYPTPRFSPGYGDWALMDQARILSLLNTDADIETGPGCMLRPVKSVTALIGWSAEGKRAAYPVGNKERCICRGAISCSGCRTWACMK